MPSGSNKNTAAETRGGVYSDVALQILLHGLTGLGRIVGDGDGDLHSVVGGELCAPGNELFGSNLVVADGLVQVVDTYAD